MNPRTALSAALAPVLLLACHGQPPPAPRSVLPVARVAVEPARMLARDHGEEFVGTVRARMVSALSASVMGTIRTLRVSVGSRVRAGSVIATLAAGEIEAKAEQARARFAQAKISLERAQSLKSKDALATSAYDVVLAEYRVAEAALAEAEATRGYLVLRAPIAGVVTAKHADVGDTALPGRPIVTIENGEQLRLEASVAEAAASGIAMGQRFAVRIDALGRAIDATVSEVAPTADPASRSVLVKLDLPPSPELRPGMFGRLLMPAAAQAALAIPESALVRHGQLESVFVVAGGKARLRLVRSGRTHGGMVEILAGLEPLEAIVVADAARLRDGQPIEPR